MSIITINIFYTKANISYFIINCSNTRTQLKKSYMRELKKNYCYIVYLIWEEYHFQVHFLKWHYGTIFKRKIEFYNDYLKDTPMNNWITFRSLLYHSYLFNFKNRTFSEMCTIMNIIDLGHFLRIERLLKLIFKWV